MKETLRQLYVQRQRLDEVIELLEDLRKRKRGRSSKNRRGPGRRSMGQEERRQVSERMKRYWENRRAAASPNSQEP